MNYYIFGAICLYLLSVWGARKESIINGETSLQAAICCLLPALNTVGWIGFLFERKGQFLVDRFFGKKD